MTSHGTNGHNALLRANYIPRQMVTAADLTADQDYFRARLRRHNRLLHGCGVICGLLAEVVAEDGQPPALHISAGSALDARGNEIEAPEDVLLTAADFCFLSASPGGGRVRATWPPPGQDPCPDPVDAALYYLAVCYHQRERCPRPVLNGNCYETSLCEPSRLEDSYQFVLLDSITPGDCLLRNADADEPAWLGQYYRYSPSPTGAPPEFPSTPPDLVRYDAAIDLAWGSSAPVAGAAPAHYMVRWSRKLYFPAGRYRFLMTAHDGVRLYVDDVLVFAQWATRRTATTFVHELLLPPGTHQVVLEYYEDADLAVAQLRWEVADLGWYAQYYQYDPSEAPPVVPPFSAQPGLVRIDPSVGFSWGAAAPAGDAQVAGEYFMARWMSDIDICAPGEYEFVCRTDDGMRVYVDGAAILDAWVAQPPTTYRPRAMLAPGRHRLVVEYFERRGGATAQVCWQQTGPYNPPCAPAAEDGCVILAALRVDNGQITGVDNFWFNPLAGYRRKILPGVELLAQRLDCLSSQPAGPGISHIVQGRGERGATINALIFGSQLAGATSVTFYGSGVTAAVLPGGGASWLPVRITISSEAELGPHFFVVMAPCGPLDSTHFNVTFEVAGLPAAPTTEPPVTFFPTATFDPGFTFTFAPTATFDPGFTFTFAPTATSAPTVTFDPGFTFTFAPTATFNPGFTFAPTATFDPGFTFGGGFTRGPGGVIIDPGGGLLNPGGVINPGGGLVDPVNVVIGPGGVPLAPVDAAGRGPVAVRAGGRLFAPGGGGIVTPPNIGLNRRVFAGGGASLPAAGDEPGAGSPAQHRPVTDVPGIGAASAEKLAAIAITSAEQLAAAAPEHLAQALNISEVRAMGLVDRARKLLAGEE